MQIFRQSIRSHKPSCASIAIIKRMNIGKHIMKYCIFYQHRNIMSIEYFQSSFHISYNLFFWIHASMNCLACTWINIHGVTPKNFSIKFIRWVIFYNLFVSKFIIKCPYCFSIFKIYLVFRQQHFILIHGAYKTIFIAYVFHSLTQFAPCTVISFYIIAGFHLINNTEQTELLQYNIRSLIKQYQ